MDAGVAAQDFGPQANDFSAAMILGTCEPAKGIQRDGALGIAREPFANTPDGRR